MSELVLRNRQESRSVDTRLLRRIVLFTLKNVLHEPKFELGIHLIGADEMAKLNETFLQHEGSTDVITFDHSDLQVNSGLHGELFISIDDAIQQAKEFRTNWQSELTRYIVHGLLHLQGYDDLEIVSRRKMKRAEESSLKMLAEEFSLSKLQRKS